MNREIILDDLTAEQLKELDEVILAEFLSDKLKDEDLADEDLLGEDGKVVETAKKLTYKERQELKDSDFALIQYVVNKKTGEKIKVRRFPIYDEAHVRNCLARLPQAKNLTDEERELVKKRALKKAKELNMTELLKKYETAGANAEPVQVSKSTEQAQVETKPEEKEKPIKVISYYTSENIETVGEDGGVDYSSKYYEKIVRTFKDGHEEIEIRDGQSMSDSKISKYTSAQLEEKVNAAKAEKDAEIATLKADAEKVKQDKDNEITSLKAEVEKEKNEKTSKDTEITNLKAELGTKTQELDTIKAKDNRTDDLNVGSVEVKGKCREDAEGIDEKAYGKKNK